MPNDNIYKAIFDQATVGIARINVATGNIIEANASFCAFFGYPEPELIKMNMQKLLNDDNQPDNLKIATGGGWREFEIEQPYSRSNRKVKWGKFSLIFIGKACNEDGFGLFMVEDITLLKERERRVAKKRQHLAKLINSIVGVVFELDIETRKSTFMGCQIEDLLGYPLEKWLSTPGFFLEILHPDDRAFVFHYLQNELELKEHHDIVVRLLAADGRIVWIREIITVAFQGGKPRTMMGIIIDISDSKQAEDTLNRSFELVNKQNQRLSSFSHIVSHNLRSHASNIQSIIGLIETAEDESERKDMIAMLRAVSNNLDETLLHLNNIINIQTAIEVTVGPLNLYDVVLTTMDTLRLQILEKDALIINHIPLDTTVIFNMAYLESIMLNLLSNALKYTNPARKAIITLFAGVVDGKLCLSIADNGIGIDLARHGDKIFGLYQTFNGNSDARGFGLFITHNQVEAMGGTISIQSELGKGTTFTVYFKS